MLPDVAVVFHGAFVLPRSCIAVTAGDLLLGLVHLLLIPAGCGGVLRCNGSQQPICSNDAVDETLQGRIRNCALSILQQVAHLRSVME